jgi:polyribonucleotide nucleotidyltransferase
LLSIIAVMIEGQADNVPFSVMKQALSKGIKVTDQIAKGIQTFAETHGKPKKTLTSKTVNPEIHPTIERYA